MTCDERESSMKPLHKITGPDILNRQPFQKVAFQLLATFLLAKIWRGSWLVIMPSKNEIKLIAP